MLKDSILTTNGTIAQTMNPVMQARFLLARLNPSNTYSTQTSMSAEMIMTDDVSLSVFTDHLRKLATSS